jgi:hypothetical protein
MLYFSKIENRIKFLPFDLQGFFFIYFKNLKGIINIFFFKIKNSKGIMNIIFF